MSLSNPTMNWSDDFGTEAEFKDFLIGIEKSKPLDTAPFSKNINEKAYGVQGKLHSYIRRVGYTGKWLLMEYEGHEVDSYWYPEISSERFIGFDPANKVSQAEFAQARR